MGSCPFALVPSSRCQLRILPDGSAVVSKRDLTTSHIPGSTWSWAPDGGEVGGDGGRSTEWLQALLVDDYSSDSSGIFSLIFGDLGYQLICGPIEFTDVHRGQSSSGTPLKFRAMGWPILGWVMIV